MPRCRLVTAPLKTRPEPNGLVTTDMRGFSKESVQRGGTSCDLAPRARARAFSLLTRSAVASSIGFENDESTASGSAFGLGIAGRDIETFIVSILPDLRRT